MISRTFFRFNTTNTISAETDDESVLDEAVALCGRYEQLLSRVDPASELYRLNHAEGRPTRVAPELAAFVETALRYCHEVDGAFDVTMGSATRLWDFKERRIPTPADVADALQHVDYRTVHVDGETVTLRDPQARIDLGGIAKGYIADGILALLRERGVSHALVNLGGNVAVAGGKPDGSAWSIGIRKPSLPRAAPARLVRHPCRARRVGGDERHLRARVRAGRHPVPPHPRPAHGLPRAHRRAERHRGCADVARRGRIHHRARHHGRRSGARIR